jgi:hypothetical protein
MRNLTSIGYVALLCQDSDMYEAAMYSVYLNMEQQTSGVNAPQQKQKETVHINICPETLMIG